MVDRMIGDPASDMAVLKRKVLRTEEGVRNEGAGIRLMVNPPIDVVLSHPFKYSPIGGMCCEMMATWVNAEDS